MVFFPFRSRAPRSRPRPDQPLVCDRPRGPRRSHVAATVSEVRHLVETTLMTYAEIAQRTGVLRATIWKWSSPQMDAAWLRAAVDPHGADVARGPSAQAPHARGPPRRARRALCARARGGIRSRYPKAARGARASRDGKAGHGAEHAALPPSRGGASGGGGEAQPARDRGLPELLAPPANPLRQAPGALLLRRRIVPWTKGSRARTRAAAAPPASRRLPARGRAAPAAEVAAWSLPLPLRHQPRAPEETDGGRSARSARTAHPARACRMPTPRCSRCAG